MISVSCCWLLPCLPCVTFQPNNATHNLPGLHFAPAVLRAGLQPSATPAHLHSLMLAAPGVSHALAPMFTCKSGMLSSVKQSIMHLQVLQNFWLSVWSNATAEAEKVQGQLHTAFYLSIYACFALSAVLLTVGRSFW